MHSPLYVKVKIMWLMYGVMVLLMQFRKLWGFFKILHLLWTSLYEEMISLFYKYHFWNLSWIIGAKLVFAFMCLGLAFKQIVFGWKWVILLLTWVLKFRLVRIVRVTSFSQQDCWCFHFFAASLGRNLIKEILKSFGNMVKIRSVFTKD